MDTMVQRPARRSRWAMTWRMSLMIVAVLVVLLIIMVWPYRKYIAPFIFGAAESGEEQAPVVSTTIAGYEDWQPHIQVVGTMTPVQGADLAFEVLGVVDKVYFHSGGDVRTGTPLVSLRSGDDLARLHTLQAAAKLAATNYQRALKLWKIKGISQQQVQEYEAALESANAQVAEARALLAKKVLRAPFSGHVGLRHVNVGDYVNPGNPVVTLQALDPIYLDFTVPQQQMSALHTGQIVSAHFDAYAGVAFSGQITTIDPKADPATRNVAVRATFPNTDRRLVPGMYAYADVDLGQPQRFLTLPQTAVTFNPYGSTVFIVVQDKPPGGTTVKQLARQVFVKTGETRGDQIQVLEGIKQGDIVVTAGQIKLQNNSPVAINNRFKPTNEQNPLPREH